MAVWAITQTIQSIKFYRGNFSSATNNHLRAPLIDLILVRPSARCHWKLTYSVICLRELSVAEQQVYAVAVILDHLWNKWEFILTIWFALQNSQMVNKWREEKYMKNGKKEVEKEWRRERVIAIKFAVQLLHQHENLLVFWPKWLEAKRLIMVRKILSPEKKSHQTAYKFNIIPFSALAQLRTLPLPLPLNIKANQLFFSFLHLTSLYYWS